MQKRYLILISITIVLAIGMVLSQTNPTEGDTTPTENIKSTLNNENNLIYSWTNKTCNNCQLAIQLKFIYNNGKTFYLKDINKIAPSISLTNTSKTENTEHDFAIDLNKLLIDRKYGGDIKVVGIEYKLVPISGFTIKDIVYNKKNYTFYIKDFNLSFKDLTTNYNIYSRSYNTIIVSEKTVNPKQEKQFPLDPIAMSTGVAK